MPRYKLTIAYDGTDFCGWQKQEPPDTARPDGGDRDRLRAHVDPSLTAAPGRLALRTVQGVLENAVRYVVREPVVLMGSSRTDAGVHARGQVAAFSCSPLDEATGEDPKPDLRSAEGPGQTPANPPTPETRHSGWPLSRGSERLLRALNGRLPEDVVITACEAVHHDFDPISDTVSKAYSYLLHVAAPVTHHADGSSTTGFRPIFDRRFVHHVHDGLDVRAMQAAASHIVGEHDFSSFAAAGHGRLTTVRTVFTCDVTDVTDQYDPRSLLGARRVRIDVSGSGFLYNMVRIIAGTLVEVGRGRLAATDLPGIIDARDRTKAGPTLPPTGLCLEWIKYA